MKTTKQGYITLADSCFIVGNIIQKLQLGQSEQIVNDGETLVVYVER